MIKINKYLAKLRRLAPTGQGGQFAFRGQANSEWKLESTVYRRHKKPPSLEEFIQYNCNLVDEAKNANYHQKGNKQLEVPRPSVQPKRGRDIMRIHAAQLGGSS
ncbi:MAG: FRG domain-containing protein [Nitrospira sp.]|nr:FRG domain-containing protein [Nitrospira sp.]